jgi:hypothetical protein
MQKNIKHDFNFHKPNVVYEYKGVLIYRYDINDEAHLAPSELIPNHVVRLSFWDKLRHKTLENGVEHALTEIHKQIDDVIIERNTKIIAEQGERLQNDK